MSMIAAMVLLADAAAATCALGAPVRLGGGAEIARAVLDYEDEAQEPPAATAAGYEEAAEAASDAEESGDAASDPAPCAMAPVPVA